MKPIGIVIALLLGIQTSLSAQDTIIPGVIVYDRIFVKGEGVYVGRIIPEYRKDSITIVTDKGASSFGFDEVDKIEYNIDRTRRQSQLRVITDDKRFEVQPYVHAPKLITRDGLKRLRNASIVLSCVGGGLHALGFGLLNAGVHSKSPFYIGYILGGSLAISAGTVVSIGSIPTWVIYALKRNKYKQQQESQRY